MSSLSLKRRSGETAAQNRDSLSGERVFPRKKLNRPDSHREMPRVPLIKFPKRGLRAPSPPATSQPGDQHATLMSPLVSGAKQEAPSQSGEIKNYRFKSDVPSPPSHTAVGGSASLLPKRKPLSEEEIEAIMQGGSF